MSWYPLGRPIGTTIYPGMQVTAVWIKNHLLDGWSINDICCLIPAWFGVLASIVTGLIAYEASIPQNSSQSVVSFLSDLLKGRISSPSISSSGGGLQVLGMPSPAVECGVITLGLMAIVPAHLMRSIGGGYDNESVAMFAMVLTFYCWMRSLRTGISPVGAFVGGLATALAYFYMVASWGT